ncbi:MAG: peptide chain release factor N(5)-glutamine methyltransferase [Xanthomonadales bacterium]|nr:peptide chain release factor N(5)-glutamine methyltransferase [Xanthomonadales bacterium]
MSDIRQLLGAATARLGGGEEARGEAEILLAHALGRSRTWLFAWPEFEPDGAAEATFWRLVGARQGGKPVAYLTGRRGFWSLELEVTPAVLIPRAETERLVELALERIPQARHAAVADLGTGSGAIALALASERPMAKVLATDASLDALAVAASNARRLGLRNIQFAEGDWCAALGDRRFDAIVSNPPYIEAGDPHLAQGDLPHEPPAALESGADGLDAIRAIIRATPAHLQAGGWLLLEHGWNQGAAVRALLGAAGFAAVATAQDLGGRDRVSSGRWPG